MKSGFTLKDYWALVKISMRSAYWRIDSRNWGKQLDGVLFWIVWIFPLGVVLALLNILNTATTFFALGVAGVIGELFKSIFLLVFCVPVTFNIKRMKYSIHFKETHTYKPSTVYYVVDMNFIDIDGKWYRGNVVCKERNCGMDENNEPIFYRTFLDPSDGWYYAKPNMTFNKRLTESDYNEATIIDIYNQKYNSPFLEK